MPSIARGTLSQVERLVAIRCRAVTLRLCAARVRRRRHDRPSCRSCRSCSRRACSSRAASLSAARKHAHSVNGRQMCWNGRPFLAGILICPRHSRALRRVRGRAPCPCHKLGRRCSLSPCTPADIRLRSRLRRAHDTRIRFCTEEARSSSSSACKHPRMGRADCLARIRKFPDTLRSHRRRSGDIPSRRMPHPGSRRTPRSRKARPRTGPTQCRPRQGLSHRRVLGKGQCLDCKPNRGALRSGSPYPFRTQEHTQSGSPRWPDHSVHMCIPRGSRLRSRTRPNNT